MLKIAKKSIVLFLLASLVFIPFGAAFAQVGFEEQEASAEAMVADVLLVRPLGFVSLVVGSALFVVSLPLSAIGGNIDAASQKLVHEPAKFVFDRPLGEF